jgi:hypothetical protein
MKTQISRDGRTSVRHDEGSHGSHALPHQNASKSSRRDGSIGLAYNLTRVMNIVGVGPLIAAIVA